MRERVPQRELAALADELFAPSRRPCDGALIHRWRLMGSNNCSRVSSASPRRLEGHGVIQLWALSATAAASVRVGCNLNFPNSVAQNWHIDGAFSREFFIANVAVVDTDLVNGAIDILPRSHREAQPYWRMAVKQAFQGHQRIEMQQGDVLVRTSRLWHRGMPNRSAVARPMLGFTFGERWVRPARPRNHFASMTVPSRSIRTAFATDMLCQLRERSYVAAPFAHTAFRFVRSVLV